MNTKPIIFLDMDGVMNNHSAFKRAKAGIYPPGNVSMMTVSHVCVSNLKTIVEATNSDIVISSSWRSGTMDCTNWDNRYGNRTVLNALNWAEFDCKHLLIGNTAHLDDKPRGDEIKHWLKNHPQRYIKHKTPYIILDDDDDFSQEQKANHFIHTFASVGLTQKNAELAIELINSQIERNKT